MIVASKTFTMVSGHTLGMALTDDVYVTKEEIYRNNVMSSISNIQMEVLYGTQTYSWEPVLNPYNGRAALYVDSRTEVSTLVFFETAHNTGYFNETITYSWGPDPYTTQQQGAPSALNYNQDLVWSIATNIPVFSSEQSAVSYLNAGTDAAALEILKTALNYQDVEYDEDTTEYYQIANRYVQATQYQGHVTPVEDATVYQRSTIFKANTPPCLYFDDTYTLHLMAKDIVSGYSVPGPISAVEQVPETSWIEESTGYSGNYYGGTTDRNSCGLNLPEPDGVYTYGSYLWTNIYIMGSREDAEEAIETGDYTKAGNYNSVQHGGFGLEPDFGEAEDLTTFGEGTWSSPFVSQYVLSASEVRDVCSVFFTDDSGLIDDIKKGLELYGAKPVDCVMSLVAFPFDVTNIANCSGQYYIYFGSYKHTLTYSVNKIFNQLSNYLDAGTIFLKPIFNNYRDYKNLTLSVFLPYIGWRDLEVEKYIKKSVNIRYYVDINTRECAAVLVANGVMADYWVGEIGVELPVVGSNFSDYARSEIQHITSFVKESMTPGSLTSIGNLAGSQSWVSTGGSVSMKIEGSDFAKYGQYKLGQNGSPKDMQMTKGSFSSGLGNYLPNYVIFRYDIHDVEEPELLNTLYGKPSTASGKISGFSGFLTGRITKLDTTGMTDSEIEELQNAIMNDGVYI